MPPPKSNKKLTAAADRDAEAVDRPGRGVGPALGVRAAAAAGRPETEPEYQIRNPIDAFVLARLEKEGLTPSPEADKETLIRRVTLDLTGLPPTPEEVDAFLAGHLAGRLREGGRSAARLAALRRADGVGLARRRPLRRHATATRATASGPCGRGATGSSTAFNAQPAVRPVHRRAARRRPAARTRRTEQKLATGFHRNHMINGEGGRIAEENRVEYVIDQTETTGTVWLGLTFNCCRCHDHKFDPLTQTDYYRLFAFFNQTPVNGGGGNPQTAPVIELRHARAGRAKLKEQRRRTTGVGEGRRPSWRRRSSRAEQGEADERVGEGRATLPQVVESALRQGGRTTRADEQLDEARASTSRTSEPEYAELLGELRKAVARPRRSVERASPRVMVMEDHAEAARHVHADRRGCTTSRRRR